MNILDKTSINNIVITDQIIQIKILYYISGNESEKLTFFYCQNQQLRFHDASKRKENEFSSHLVEMKYILRMAKKQQQQLQYYKCSQYLESQIIIEILQMSTSQTSQKPEMSKERVVSNQPIKNYFEILGVNPDATLRDIENAYQKLALKWHPDKHTVDRRLAERKFQQISEAYDVLSDPNRRSTYSQMMTQQSSLENAYRIFDRFFGQSEMLNEDEEKFFEKHFPDRRKNYYKILGVNKDASMDDITNAYRKLALQYHPKSNPNNEQAHRKFVEVNEAYQTLSNKLGRSTYDDLVFGQIVPRRAFDIFENFFEDRWMDMPSETEFFTPIFNRRRPWQDIGRLGMGTTGRDLTTLPLRQLGGNIKEGESFFKEERYEKKNGKENHTSQTVKRKIKDGEVEEEILKENILPNGEKDVMKTLKRGDRVVDSKTYHLKPNENMPRELTNI